jgi:hypothetical protein
LDEDGECAMNFAVDSSTAAKKKKIESWRLSFIEQEKKR